MAASTDQTSRPAPAFQPTEPLGELHEPLDQGRRPADEAVDDGPGRQQKPEPEELPQRGARRPAGRPGAIRPRSSSHSGSSRNTDGRRHQDTDCAVELAGDGRREPHDRLGPPPGPERCQQARFDHERGQRQARQDRGRRERSSSSARAPAAPCTPAGRDSRPDGRGRRCRSAGFERLAWASVRSADGWPGRGAGGTMRDDLN